jgi:putative acetyltransferase
MTKNKKIVIRPPKMSDLEDLLSMVNSLVKEKAMISIQKKLTVKEEETYLKSIIGSKNSIDLVLTIDGKVVGIAGAYKRGGIQNHVGEIGILIGKDARGLGLGEKLFREVIEKGIKKFKFRIFSLNVFAENKIAIGLYKKVGFKKIGLLKEGVSYYGTYIDSIIMAKYIN